MRTTHKQSIRTSIYATSVFAVAAVLVTATVLHSHFLTQQSEASQNAAVTLAAQMIASEIHDETPASPEAMEDTCRRLATHPMVLGICLWNTDGEVIASTGRTRELRDRVGSLRPSGNRSRDVSVISVPQGRKPDGILARYVEVDLGSPERPGLPSRMAVLFEPNAPRAAEGNYAAFCIPLMTVGFSSVLLASWWLRRELIRPIRALLNTTDPAACVETPLLADRQDELGAIARSLAELHSDLGAWRERAELIERRVESRIAAKTRQITRDLKRIQREAWLDPLTGVNNRRMLEEELPQILAAQREARADLSVVMLDLDHFKITNDKLGHATGDTLLAFLGELLRQCLRSEDIAVRYGGDEFLLILPGVSAPDGLALSNRIIAMFGQRAKTIANVQPAPSLSAGVASLQRNRPSDHRALVNAADRALYEAKQAGKKTAHVADCS
jgi:diguanylate cyclase (GGDEF)-like protein